jgi:hypothetical protein
MGRRQESARDRRTNEFSCLRFGGSRTNCGARTAAYGKPSGFGRATRFFVGLAFGSGTGDEFRGSSEQSKSKPDSGPTDNTSSPKPGKHQGGNIGSAIDRRFSKSQRKKLSPEFTNSSSRELLAKFIRNLENQIKRSYSSLPANIRERRTGQCARRPLAEKTDNRRAGPPASLYRARWFYGSSPSWWKEIDAVVNLPRWRNQCGSLQRWLKGFVRPFQREPKKSH